MTVANKWDSVNSLIMNIFKFEYLNSYICITHVGKLQLTYLPNVIVIFYRSVNKLRAANPMTDRSTQSAI